VIIIEENAPFYAEVLNDLCDNASVGDGKLFKVNGLQK
jgi:hypothetical protein